MKDSIDNKRNLADLAPWLCFAICLVVFVLRAAPGVTFEDSGELAAAATCLGVPHPPGYPLQMLLGHGFIRSMSALIEDPARALNLFSALCAAGAAALLALFARRTGAGFGAALATGLLLALAPTFAAQAVITEVYALAALLQVALLLVCLRPGDPKPGTALFFFGLALCAHANSLAFAPLPLLVLARALRSGTQPRERTLLQSMFGISAGLAFYLYVPLAAASDAPINWGAATGGERLLDHLLRTQYATGLDRAFENQLSLLAEQFAGQWPLVFAALILSTFFVRRNLERRQLTPVFCTIVFAAGTLFYAINWPLADELSRARVAGSYIPLVIIVCAFGSAILVGLERTFSHTSAAKVFSIALPLVVVLLALPFGPRTFANDLDQSEAKWAELYGRETLAACPPNSVLVISKLGYGDDLAFPLLYLQVARHVREDVLVLPREFLSHPWYREQLSEREPWLTPALRSLSEKYAASAGLPGDPRSQRIVNASFFPDLFKLADAVNRPTVFVSKPSPRLLGQRRTQTISMLWSVVATEPTAPLDPHASEPYAWLPAVTNDPILLMLKELKRALAAPK
ncbi:MAG: hypothetical protein ACI8TQ_002938 [Planctomycetota bacterium]